VADARLPRAGSRRRFLRAAAAALGSGAVTSGAWLTRLAAQPLCAPMPAGELVRQLPLYGAGAEEVPLGQLVGGAGLDARLFTDLTPLAPGRLTTPTADVFVRTTAPPGLAHAPAAWTLSLPGRPGGAPRQTTAAELVAASQAMGEHLIECAGNSNPRNFGLMSSVAWHGVPVADLVMAGRPTGATALLVTGADHEGSASGRSLGGASWVLPATSLEALRPFIATRMNGEPLTPDHGAPVRLVVPGWYGCAWIKWVTSIAWVGADTPATTQMLEFAFRTHQDGIPELARDYQAPAIDTAAMPIRVEQWRVAGATEYRVVGIVWGGTQPVDRLLIRFGSREAGDVVQVCPAPAHSRTWALWTYRWRPEAPGPYDISLKAADAAVPTRRLDLSFYIRRVHIDEV